MAHGARWKAGSLPSSDSGSDSWVMHTLPRGYSEFCAVFDGMEMRGKGEAVFFWSAV